MYARLIIMSKWIDMLLIITAIHFVPSGIHAHLGPTDDNDGHYDTVTGIYHYHITQSEASTPQSNKTLPATAEVERHANETLWAIADAQRHAEADYTEGAGFCLGAGCGLFGMGASYLYEGKLPAHRLAALEDKSNTYIFVYKEEYLKEIKRKRTTESVVGYVIGLVLVVGLFVASSN